MKFYLKILATLIGVLLVVFVGIQAYTSIEYCNTSSTKSTLEKFGEYIYGNIFYSPLEKSCYHISNGGGGLTMDGYQISTDKPIPRKLIQKPTRLQSMINILGFGPRITESTLLPWGGVPSNCLIPGLINIRRDNGSINDRSSLDIEKGLIIEDVTRVYYTRPIKVILPGLEILPSNSTGDIFAKFKRGMDILTGVDEYRWNNMISIIENKPYINGFNLSNASFQKLTTGMRDGYTLSNQEISIKMNDLNANDIKDRMITVNEFGFIESIDKRSSIYIKIKVNPGEEDKQILLLKSKLPESVVIERLASCGRFVQFY